jgi:hypothetical protein
MELVNSFSSEGQSDIFRKSVVLSICLRQADLSCARETAEILTMGYAALTERSGRELIDVEYALNLINHRVRAPDNSTMTTELEADERRLASLPLLYSGGRIRAGREYRRASALAELGRSVEAIEELQMTLSLSDGRFVARDAFGARPEHGIFLTPLKNQPGYDEWFEELTARRAAMRESMIALERAGMIEPMP